MSPAPAPKRQNLNATPRALFSTCPQCKNEFEDTSQIDFIKWNSKCSRCYLVGYFGEKQSEEKRNALEPAQSMEAEEKNEPTEEEQNALALLNGRAVDQIRRMSQKTNVAKGSNASPVVDRYWERDNWLAPVSQIGSTVLRNCDFPVLAKGHHIPSKSTTAHPVGKHPGRKRLHQMIRDKLKEYEKDPTDGQRTMFLAEIYESFGGSIAGGPRVKYLDNTRTGSTWVEKSKEFAISQWRKRWLDIVVPDNNLINAALRQADYPPTEWDVYHRGGTGGGTVLNCGYKKMMEIFKKNLDKFESVLEGGD
ncbi:MAG: hypothetical protein SGARI_003726, partial [Bacillariaceae sp.]